MFPLPAWKGITDFVNREGVLLAVQPVSPVPAPAPSSTPSGGIDSKKRPAGPCFIFLQHGYCRVKRHDLTDLAAPVAGSTGNNHYGSA